jgi:hypothetical protein
MIAFNKTTGYARATLQGSTVPARNEIDSSPGKAPKGIGGGINEKLEIIITCKVGLQIPCGVHFKTPP